MNKFITDLYRKVLVFTIIILFIGTGVVSGINGNIQEKNKIKLLCTGVSSRCIRLEKSKKLDDIKEKTTTLNRFIKQPTLYERYNTGDDASLDIQSCLWVAQTFTVGNTGTNEDHNITSVKLLLHRAGLPGTLTVSIRAVDGNGKPTGNDLTSGTTNGNTLTTDAAGEWQEISLTSYELLAGTQYVIVARAPSGDSSNHVYWRSDNTNPTYTGGCYVYSPTSGGIWFVATSIDLIFEEYGTSVSDNNPPNTPSTPSGPTSGNVGDSLTYSASTTDPDNDDVKYGWDWNGDNIIDEWTGFYSSGETISTSHSWDTEGTYNVKVKAEDSNGGQSGFSNVLQVVISDNQPPDTPDKPFGATSVIVHHPHRYQTSAVDPDGNMVQYYFDWGDGEGDWTCFVDSGEDEGYDHVWREPGVYQVKAKARDEHDAESGWSEPLTVTVEEEVNHPPNKPTKPSGQESGKAGVKYNYSTSAVDPDGDQIKYYLWDWGDGVDNRSTIYGPFDSGQTVEMPHIWDKKGSYEVKVWAIDVKGAQSYHSDPLLVSMPKCKPSFDSLFWFFEQLMDRYPFLEESILNMYKGGR